ncbi:MAG: hypothetical protein E3K32_07400 [wastewater metagenome]|nr:hypothetical protein [Candidatus Loosdrechtia aerotolerans]
MRTLYVTFLNKEKRKCGKKFIKSGLRGAYSIVVCVFLFSLFCNTLSAHSDSPPLGCLGIGHGKYGWNLYAPDQYTCGNVACHYQYPIGSGKGKFMLFVLDECEPGEVVDILVSFKQTDTDFHGFQITAQDRYYNRLVGTFINVGDDEDTQIEGSGNYASHTKKGTEQRYWHVKWQAPPADFWIANPVRFFAMGVEADNDGTPMGDYVYTATRLLVVKQKREKKEVTGIYRKE